VPPDGDSVTRQVSRVLPSDAGSVRWTFEVVNGRSSSASRKRRGWVAGLRRPRGALGQLEYPTPPLRARQNLDRHPNYILAAYMASGT
jgi:hypothetical protein